MTIRLLITEPSQPATADHGTPRRIRVLVVGTASHVCDGLLSSFDRAADMVVVGQAATAAEAKEIYLNLRPDVVTTCLSLPDKDGAGLIRDLTRIDQDVAIVAFDLESKPDCLSAAHGAGAKTCVDGASADPFQNILAEVRRIAGRSSESAEMQRAERGWSRIRAHLESWVDISIVGNAQTPEEVVDFYARFQPDVVTIWRDMPAPGGVAATEKLLTIDEHAAVVFLDAQSSPTHVCQAISAGAIDYIAMPASAEVYLSSVERAAASQRARPSASAGIVAAARLGLDGFKIPAAGPVRGRQLDYPRTATVKLAGGRIVIIEAYTARRTYEGVLLGRALEVSLRLWETLPLRIHEMLGKRAWPIYVDDPDCPVIPAYTCLARLSSSPIGPDADGSRLYLCWFTDYIDAPVADMVGEALYGVAWDRLAQDWCW